MSLEPTTCCKVFGPARLAATSTSWAAPDWTQTGSECAGFSSLCCSLQPGSTFLLSVCCARQQWTGLSLPRRRESPPPPDSVNTPRLTPSCSLPASYRSHSLIYLALQGFSLWCEPEEPPLGTLTPGQSECYLEKWNVWVQCVQDFFLASYRWWANGDVASCTLCFSCTDSINTANWGGAHWKNESLWNGI